jgi:hypothetical protein
MTPSTFCPGAYGFGSDRNTKIVSDASTTDDRLTSPYRIMSFCLREIFFMLKRNA